MRLLLLDDATKTDLVAMEQAATSLGHDVVCTHDLDAFLATARQQRNEIEGYVVDFSIPDSRDTPGLRDGPDVVSLDAAESYPIPTMFLTNYPPDCDRRLNECDPRLIATVVAKPTKSSVTAWAEAMQSGFSELNRAGSNDQPESLGIPLDSILSPFFGMSPQELLNVPDAERDRLEIAAAGEIHTALGPIWRACADDWLMLQAVDGVVLVAGRGSDDSLPTIDSVQDIEFDRAAPALVVGRPSIIEELGLIDCSPPRYKNWRRYPFVRLIVGTDQREFHLDTGSPTSYISLEFVEAHIEMPRVKTKRSNLGNLGGQEETISEIPVDVPLHVAGPRGNVALDVRLSAVKDWHTASILNPRCDEQKCPRSSGGQCGRRLGLIGRDTLYTYLTGVWQLDPITGQFFAVGGSPSVGGSP